MELKEAFTLAQSADFIQSVRIAAVRYAVVVALKDAGTAHQQLDEKRLQLAFRVIADGCLSEQNRLVYGVVSQPDFPSGPSDDEITNAIAQAWNLLAGVTDRDAKG